MKYERTRFKWHDKQARGWAITEGYSLFLIAEGSGYSRAVGLTLFKYLSNRATRKCKKGIWNHNT